MALSGKVPRDLRWEEGRDTWGGGGGGGGGGVGGGGGGCV
jgi:hypothetical protein